MANEEGVVVVFYATTTLPFGDVVLTASHSGTTESFEVSFLDITPRLPEGMSVEHFAALLVQVTTRSEVHNFTFDCRVTSCDSQGDPNSGENLDAQSWGIGRGLLMIGTEDGESLDNRIHWFSLTSTLYPVTYLTDGFRVSFPYVPPKQKVDFHFILAHNHVDRQCDSEWFAVDIPHHTLLNAKSTRIDNAV